MTCPDEFGRGCGGRDCDRCSPLKDCQKCGKHTQRIKQQAYGISTDCAECGHHTYFSIGD